MTKTQRDAHRVEIVKLGETKRGDLLMAVPDFPFRPDHVILGIRVSVRTASEVPEQYRNMEVARLLDLGKG